MVLRILLILAVIFELLKLQAQPYVDVIQLSGARLGPFISDTQASFFLPLDVGNGNYILAGAGYGKVRMHTQESLPVHLTVTSAQLGTILQGKNGWRFLLMATPKISSDFEDVSHRDYQWGGLMLASKEVRPGFTYKFGAYANREFFGTLIIPLIGMDWRVNERLQVFGVLPGQARMEYRFDDRLYGGFFYQSITTSYRLSGQQEHRYIRSGHPFFGEFQMGGFLEFYPLNQTVLKMEVGHTAFREVRLFESDRIGEVATPLNDLTNQFFIRVGAAYRIRTDNP